MTTKRLARLLFVTALFVEAGGCTNATEESKPDAVSTDPGTSRWPGRADESSGPGAAKEWAVHGTDNSVEFSGVRPSKDDPNVNVLVLAGRIDRTASHVVSRRRGPSPFGWTSRMARSPFERHGPPPRGSRVVTHGPRRPRRYGAGQS